MFFVMVCEGLGVGVVEVGETLSTGQEWEIVAEQSLDHDVDFQI